MTPTVDGYKPCVCCRTKVLVFAGRSYLPGPLCRGCKKMCEEIACADDARDDALLSEMKSKRAET